MTWHVAPPGEGGEVLLSISGQVDPPSLRDAFAAALGACLEHDCFRVLCDVTALEAGHTVVDLYAIVTSMTESPVPPTFREAVVVGLDPAVVELARFFETAATNRGLMVRVFDDRAEASAWLSS